MLTSHTAYSKSLLQILLIFLFSLRTLLFLFLVPQTFNTPAQPIQIFVCKYLYLHKHLCLAVCYGQNTSVAPLTGKEMSLPLLTFPALHTPQAPLHHPSVWHMRNSLCFLLVLCQQGGNNSKKWKCIYTSAVSSWLRLSSLVHSYPCVHLNSPCHQEVPIALSGCCSLPLSARLSSHPFPAFTMLPCCL